MIHINSGKYKGCNLSVAHGVRPTTNRARSTIFDILMSRPTSSSNIIDNNTSLTNNSTTYTTLSYATPYKQALDCFAGTGALGIEALSRHCCNFVTFVEMNPNIFEILRNNLTNINNKYEIDTANNMPYSIINRNIFKIGKASKIYDLILIDPPFKMQTPSIKNLNTSSYKKWMPTKNSVHTRERLCTNNGVTQQFLDLMYQSAKTPLKSNQNKKDKNTIINPINCLLIYLAHNNWLDNDGCDIIIERGGQTEEHFMIDEQVELWCQALGITSCAKIASSFHFIKSVHVGTITISILHYQTS